MQEVIVNVEDGSVRGVQVPPGIRVIVHDYDEPRAANTGTDENGNVYGVFVHEHRDEAEAEITADDVDSFAERWEERLNGDRVKFEDDWSLLVVLLLREIRDELGCLNTNLEETLDQ